MAYLLIASDQENQIVGINAETVTDVTSTDYSGHYPGELMRLGCYITRVRTDCN
jgi:hypothetical protein